jgi:uncharacterized membrane protein
VTWGILFRVRQYLKGSLWVLPLAGGVLGWGLGLAASDGGTLYELPERWQYSAGTAQAVLAAVVGASVGLTGFVVTVTVLVVQMATGTFSARYMRLFYRDRVLKAVLAMLIGTFTFSYTLLRHVEADAVPNFGVTVAGFAMGTGLLLFVVFLNRFLHRMRPVAVAALVGAAGRRAFREVISEASRSDAHAIVPAPYEAPGEPTLVVRSAHGGAVQALDTRGLLSWSQSYDCLVVLRHPIGDFVPAGSALIEVYGGSHDPRLAERRLRSMIALGVERTIEQDPAFAVRTMVDIAIRALSPAVNDPTTAVQVLDHLEDFLRTIGTTPIPAQMRRTESLEGSGVVIPVRRWEDYVTLASTEIREYGGRSIQTVRRLRAMLEELQDAVLPERRPVVEEELERLDTTVAAHWGDTVDLDLASIADRQGIGGPGTAEQARAQRTESTR